MRRTHDQRGLTGFGLAIAVFYRWLQPLGARCAKCGLFLLEPQPLVPLQRRRCLWFTWASQFSLFHHLTLPLVFLTAAVSDNREEDA